MRDFTKRPAQRGSLPRFLGGILGVVVLGFVTFGAAHSAWGMYGKFNEAAVSDADAQQNLASLKAQDAQVSAQVASLSSERGQEAQIRQSYGVALPGEGEIQIVREAPSSTPEQASAPSFWAKLWQKLFVW